MNTIEFSKIKGETLDVGAILKKVERLIGWLMNGNYELKITKKVKRRSLPQNRLMWMWFACIGQDTGQPPQDVHDYYCLKYLPREVANPATGERVIVAGHTSLLSTEAFTEFLNQVQADAATELGITLPVPDDEGFSDFEDTYKQYAR